MPLQRQLVIFSADSARASLTDLAGLLMGAAHLTTMGGTARVSVQVDAAWRVHALAAEFAARGLSIGWAQDADGEYWVRTSYARVLVGLQPPSFLDGLRLRLWFMASGRLEDGSIVLRLGNNHAMARRALAPLGLDGAIETGPAIRITGAEKVTRFGDLIGERPAAAPEGAWPPPRRPAPADDRAAVAAGGKRSVGRQARAANGADAAEDLLVLGGLLGVAEASEGEESSGAAGKGDATDPTAGHVAEAETPGSQAVRRGGAEARGEVGEADRELHGAGEVSEVPGEKPGETPAGTLGDELGQTPGEEAGGVAAGKRRTTRGVKAPKSALERGAPTGETAVQKRAARSKAAKASGEPTAPETVAGEEPKAAPRKRAPRKATRSKETSDPVVEGAAPA